MDLKNQIQKREIKFRAWDSKNNHMFYHDDEGNFERRIEVDRVGSDFNVNDLLFSPFECLELMQFTGLKDKKGIDIYEGDICKYHKNTSKWLVSYHFEVRFKNGAFYAYWEREMFGQYEKHWDLLSQKDMRNIKVASSIHDNPELL